MQAQVIGSFPDAPMVMRHMALPQPKGPERVVHRVRERRHTANIRAYNRESTASGFKDRDAKRFCQGTVQEDMTLA